MPFSQAGPRVVEAVDVISTLDQRPNLLDLTPEAFESFVQNLFTKMGYETRQIPFQPGWRHRLHRLQARPCSPYEDRRPSQALHEDGLPGLRS